MKKRIFQNNEGISPVLGFILILAIGVTLLTTVQLSFVPVWNTQEELDHIKLMHNDFKVLKSNIESGIQSGTTLSSPLIMGFKYSPKMLVYNPRDEAYASLDISNNAWVEVRYNEVFSEGMTDDTSIKNISTGMITYALHGARNYNSFIYENGLIRRSGSNYTTNSQTVLANNTIFLQGLKAPEYGSVSGVEKRTVNIYPTSQQKNSVIGQNVWLILHTDPNYVDWWETNLGNEGATVRKKDATNGIVIANISSSAVIKMGEAYISTSQKASSPHSPAKRIVKISGIGTSLPVGGTTAITVEVQDEYNNPVPNVLVSFITNTSSNGHPGNSHSNATVSPGSAVSGSDGRASVTLTANDAGFYYIDASMTDYKTTIVYSASSQGSVIKLDSTPSGSDHIITATLRNSLGIPVTTGTNVDFETSDGILSDYSRTTVYDGTANTTLNVSGATGIKIMNIHVKNTTSNTTNITWNTNNNITVTAKSGYVFNSRIVPADVNTSGCVFYGTSPHNYSLTPVCDNNTASFHSVSLPGLSSYSAYYFIVNSSRSGGSNMNSTEYMFVTDAGEIISEVTPPASVTNLQNFTGSMFIRWTWTDPADADLKNVDIKIDNGATIYTVNKGIQSFNATYLMPNSSHNISIRTVDTSNNANATWVTQKGSTPSLMTYVFSFSNSSGHGIVTGGNNARNDSDGVASALLNETSTVGSSMKDNYTYVSSNTTTNGTISNWINMQSNNSAYATMTEGADTVYTSYWWGFNTTIESWNPTWTGSGGTVANTSAWVNDGNPAGGIYSRITTTSTTARTRTSTWTSPAFTWNGGTPSSASLNFDWKVQTYTLASAGSYYVNLVKPDASTVQIYPTTSYGGTAAWSAKSNTSLTLSDFSQSGNYKIQLISVMNTPGGSGTKTVEVRWDNPNITLGTTTYSLNIITSTTNVHEDLNSNYYLEINYSRDAGETGYDVYVSNGTDWIFKGSLTSSSWSPANFTLSGSEIITGNVDVLYLDRTPTGATQGNLYIDYQRVHNVTPVIPPGYHLDITANNTGIADASAHKLQLRYNVTGDNFTLLIYNGSTLGWDAKETLNKSAMTTIEVPLSLNYLLSDGAFSPGTVNDLPRYYVLVRYIDESTSKQGKLYLDYQRVYSS